MTPVQQAIAILEEDALTNRIERALEVLRGVPQSPAAIGFAAYHPTLGWRPDLAAKSAQIATALVMRSIDGAAAAGWEVRPIYDGPDTRPDRNSQ